MLDIWAQKFHTERTMETSVVFLSFVLHLCKRIELLDHMQIILNVLVYDLLSVSAIIWHYLACQGLSRFKIFAYQAKSYMWCMWYDIVCTIIRKLKLMKLITVYNLTLEAWTPVKSLETWVDGHRYSLICPWASADIHKWAISWSLNWRLLMIIYPYWCLSVHIYRHPYNEYIFSTTVRTHPSSPPWSFLPTDSIPTTLVSHSGIASNPSM